jgi:methionine transaminase
VTVTAGATEALATAISALVQLGDEVIVFEPTYDSYVPLVEVNGGKTVPIELKAPYFLPDWDEVRRAITEKTKAVIVNTPHNPCGAILRSEDLDELAKIVHENDLYVISDEVYEHIVFDGHKHLSIGSHPELYKKSFVISSFGKTFHATGWKCGYCLAPEELTKEFRKVHQFIVYSVNTPVQFAYADYLSQAENYLKVGPMYEQKRDLVLDSLADSDFICTPAAGSYFQLLDTSKVHVGTGMELAQRLAKENSVALIPLEPFYRKFVAPPYIRICFAKKDLTLKAGLKNLISLSADS